MKFYDTRFACPSCGRFVSVANIHQEDYRDPSAYYGIGTTTAITCSRCGLVEAEPSITFIGVNEVTS